MKTEDMIMISVDDHVVEPPDMFDGRLPAKYDDRSPEVEHTDDGNDVWVFNGSRSRTSGSTRSPVARRRSTGSTRPPSTRCVPVASTSHERVKDMNAGGVLACMCFPSFPVVLGPAVRGVRRQGPRARGHAGVQRLAHRRVVRRVSRALHPDGAADAVGPGARAPTRSAASPAKGCHSLTFTENPAALGQPSFHDDHWDPMWQALVDEGTILNIHLGSSGQLAVTAPDAPMDVMITLQPMNICMAAADLVWSRVFKEFPDAEGRALRGRHRLDPVLPRPARPHLRHAPPVDRSGLRRPHAVRRLPRAHPHVLHRRPRRVWRSATRSASTTSAGSRTTRTPTRRGRRRPRSS